MKHKVVISVNTAWNLYNFRSGLIARLIDHGYEVIAMAPDDGFAPRLEQMGCTFIKLSMDSNGTNPWRDLRLLVRYFVLLRSIRPSAYLGYTVKPNVYGSLAARMLGIPTINNIAGLGATFISSSFLTSVVMYMYKLGLRRSHRVFFQNPDDRALFIEHGLVHEEITSLVPGSGVNVAHFRPNMRPAGVKGPFCFLLVGRMLRDKGIHEYIDAARRVRKRYPDVRFQLLGSVDEGNPNAVPLAEIIAVQEEGVVEYLGRADDVRTFMSKADCIVLPSYREGVPRSLLEAAALARPIIATDVAGCREAVDNGKNGFLCAAKSAGDLAAKMEQMLQLSVAERGAMGLAGRRKVEIQFDERIVIQKYLKVLAQVAAPIAEIAEDSALVSE
jgi:glycosyltransferase involved in cell wall biosynthesis